MATTILSELMTTTTPMPIAPLQSRSRPPISPLAMVRALTAHRDLVWQMVKRDVVGRYRGSAMGLLWSFLHPLLMLLVYTFAFSYVLRVRLTQSPNETMIDFAIWLFAGLIVFGLFNEIITRAPTLILGNSAYVKRIVFPLEIFPFITIGSALIHAGMSTLVLLIAFISFHQTVHWTIVLFPFVLLPFLLLTLGLAWFLASLGVFLRDVAQTVGIACMVLLYLSPVFFRTDTIPSPALQWLVFLNPLTIPTENTRRVLLDGQLPQMLPLTVYTGVALLIAWLGFAWFQRTKRGFADVL